MLFDFVLVFFSSFGCLISASHYVFCFCYVFFCYIMLFALGTLSYFCKVLYCLPSFSCLFLTSCYVDFAFASTPYLPLQPCHQPRRHISASRSRVQDLTRNPSAVAAGLMIIIIAKKPVVVMGRSRSLAREVAEVPGEIKSSLGDEHIRSSGVT